MWSKHCFFPLTRARCSDERSMWIQDLYKMPGALGSEHFEGYTKRLPFNTSFGQLPCWKLGVVWCERNLLEKWEFRERYCTQKRLTLLLDGLLGTMFPTNFIPAGASL